MSRKTKCSLDEKLKGIKEYLSGEKSVVEICDELSINGSTFYDWVKIYNDLGELNLIISTKNKCYSDSLKLKAVEDYLAGKGSLRSICNIYGISCPRVLRDWIKKYNGHNIEESRKRQGDRIMTNGRKTTYEERIKIVAFCIANNDDYQETADKFKVSYQQVYAWVRKYKNNGCEALLDRRGKRKEAINLSESEKLSMQLKLIEAENKRLKMENDFLKKLEQIERRR
ncbi:transposase [Clostridium botulinum]|uniref:Transposase n=1 Tax=Clostridium botulinum TaxID=1491 RepID=A0A6M0SV21_CLOBO|nr:transposase [Clostridium botulinum]NFO12596.1 transposase [Clostridium botulinum]